MGSYKELLVWRKSFDFYVSIYQITDGFPKEELYGLTSQIRRAAISIPSNISEASKRGKKEFAQFLRIAHRSSAELETQLLLAQELGYIETINSEIRIKELNEIMAMLGAFVKKLTADL